MSYAGQLFDKSWKRQQDDAFMATVSKATLDAVLKKQRKFLNTSLTPEELEIYRTFKRVEYHTKKEEKTASGVKQARPPSLARPLDDEAFLAQVPKKTLKDVFRRQKELTSSGLTDEERQIYRAYKRNWYRKNKARTECDVQATDHVYQMPDPDGHLVFGEIIPPPL